MADILTYLTNGYALTSHELAVLTGMPERAVRAEIERLRRDWPIINMQDGKGYRLETKNIDVLKQYQKQEKSRAIAIFYRLAGVNKQIKALEGATTE